MTDVLTEECGVSEPATTPYIMSMDYAGAQRLMDGLYRCGVRPTEEAMQRTGERVLSLIAENEWLRRVVTKLIGGKE